MSDTGRLTSFARKELGASNIGTIIMGEGFLTPNDILKAAVTESSGMEIEQVDNPKVIAGKALEEPIAQLFRRAFEEQIASKVVLIQPRKAYIHELSNGKLGSSIDRMLVLDKTYDVTDSTNKNWSLGPGEVVVEIKNFSGHQDSPIRPSYPYQLQQQMLCCKAKVGILVRLINGWDLQWFVFERDEQMIEDIENAGTDFWNRFDGVIENKDFWYDPHDTKEASKLYKGNQSKEVVDMGNNDDLKPLIEKFVKARDEEKLAKIRKDEASLQIKMHMKDVELASYQGYLLRHTTSKRQKTKVIKIPDEYTETRVFTIKES